MQKMDSKLNYSIRRDLVKQSHAMVFGGHDITWVGYKLLFLLMSRVLQTGGNERRFKSSVDELCETLHTEGYGGNRYAMLRDLLKELLQRGIEVEEEGKRVMFPLLAYAEYDRGSVEIELNRYFEQHLLNLKSHFTITPLQPFLSLPSLTAGRLLVLLYTLKAFESPTLRTLSIEEVARFVEIDPSRPYAKLKQSLQRAQTAIQHNTSLTFKLVEIKTGKKVAAIRFDGIKETTKK